MRLPQDDVGNAIQPGARAVETSPLPLVDGTVIFTLTGHIAMNDLRTTLKTATSSLAATVQYMFTPNSLYAPSSAQAVSGVSAAISNASTGDILDHIPNSLTSAPVLTRASSGGITPIPPLSRMRLPPGVLSIRLATVSSLAGTATHSINYDPLSPNSTVG
jgi:hypothetical protein